MSKTLRNSKQKIDSLSSYIKDSLIECEQGYFEYDEWKIFHDPGLLSLVTQSLCEKVLSSRIEFDTIGALGGSGTPLATSLALEFLRKGFSKNFIFISDPLIGISSLWVKKIKPDLARNQRSVLLVDTEIKSGRTIWDGCKKIQEMGAQAKGLAVITDYTGFPDRSDYEQIVVAARLPIVKLFDFDPLKPELTVSP